MDLVLPTFLDAISEAGIPSGNIDIPVVVGRLPDCFSRTLSSTWCRRGLCRIFCRKNWVSARREGMKRMDEIYRVPIPGLADILLASEDIYAYSHRIL
jgi:hypothetical protein